MSKLGVVAALVIVFCVSGCSAEKKTTGHQDIPVVTVQSVGSVGDKGDKTVTKRIKLNISRHEYMAVLEDNPASRQLMAKFPMTLEMEELNGNEKYYRFAESFPTNDEDIGQIHAGDIMLFSGHYVVIFYKDFPSQYQYTRLGHIENPKALSEAVGTSSVAVEFQNEYMDKSE